MLREEFLAAALPYTDSVKAVALWDEVDAIGRKRGRYYHARDHFEQLLHVLRPSIFKTTEFRNEYEHQARLNLNAELQKLS